MAETSLLSILSQLPHVLSHLGDAGAAPQLSILSQLLQSCNAVSYASRALVLSILSQLLPVTISRKYGDPGEAIIVLSILSQLLRLSGDLPLF